MSGGTPDDPNQRPMPWDAKPDGSGADPSWPSDPTEVVPTPDPRAADAVEPAEPVEPADAVDPLVPEPAAQAGLISAAPVGWGASQVSTTGPAAAAPQGSGGEPATSWAAPPSASEVPGAPGLVFAGAVPRVVAWIVDGVIAGIIAGIIAYVLFLAVASVAAAGGSDTGTTALTGLLAVASVIVSALYFVFFWTGGRRATPGQRMFGIQVGNAFDGQALSTGQAVRRWLGYGEFILVLGIMPGLDGYASLAFLVWSIVLLVTTVTSSTKQGLHDRFANTALVRPAGASSSGIALACLIIVALLFVLPIIAIIGLIALGGQVSSILSAVGESI